MGKMDGLGILPSIITCPRALPPTVNLCIPVRFLVQGIQTARRTRRRSSATSTPAGRAGT
jgi:hypothetical protein